MEEATTKEGINCEIIMSDDDENDSNVEEVFETEGEEQDNVDVDVDDDVVDDTHFFEAFINSAC